MAKIGMDFSTELHDDTQTGFRPWYKVVAKGDIKDVRDVIAVFQEAEVISQERADLLLKLIPSVDSNDTQEAESYIEIPYEKAKTLQKFLLGWGGKLQQLINSAAKTGMKNKAGEDVDVEDWEKIEFDLSLFDNRKVSFGQRILSSLSIWNSGGINLTNEEWNEVTKGLSAGEANLIAAKQVVKTTSETVSAAFAETARQMGITPEELQRRLRKKAIKLGLFAVGGVTTIAVSYAVLRFWVLRPRVTVNLDKEKKDKKGGAK